MELGKLEGSVELTSETKLCLPLSAEKARFVQDLTKELREENLAIFAGAGLSVPAGFVNWGELLKPIAEDLGLEIERESADLISLAQYHCNKFGGNRNKLNQLLIDQFCTNAKITENHEILARFANQYVLDYELRRPD